MRKLISSNSDWLESSLPQTRIRQFRLLLASSIIIKAYSSFPVFDHETVFQSINLILAFAAGILLLVEIWPRYAMAVGMVALSTLYFNAPTNDWVSHNTQLLIFCLAASFVERSKQNSERWLPGYRLLQVLIFIIYLSAIYLKINPTYLSGIRLQQIFMLRYGSSDMAPWVHFEIFCKVAAWASLVTEILIVIGLYTHKFRKAAVYLGIAFHFSLAVFLPVSVFSLLMIALLLLFLEEDKPLKTWLKNEHTPSRMA